MFKSVSQDSICTDSSALPSVRLLSLFMYLVIFLCLHILKQEVSICLVVCLVVYFSEIVFKFSSPVKEEETVYIFCGLIVLD